MIEAANFSQYMYSQVTPHLVVIPFKSEAAKLMTADTDPEFMPDSWRQLNLSIKVVCIMIPPSSLLLLLPWGVDTQILDQLVLQLGY